MQQAAESVVFFVRSYALANTCATQRERTAAHASSMQKPVDGASGSDLLLSFKKQRFQLGLKQELLSHACSARPTVSESHHAHV
jgi:hypothetical protein